MDWLRFSRFSIGNMTTLIILWVILVYLVKVKEKPNGSWYLFGYIVGLAVLLISYLLRYSILINKPLQLGGMSDLIVFTIIFNVLFAYNFPENRHRKESIIFLILFWGAALYAFVSTTLLEPGVFSFSAHYFARPTDPRVAIVAGMGYIWTAVVFFRKAALWRLRGAMARSLLAFGLLTLATFLISFSYILFSLDIITRATYSTIFTNGALFISLSIFIVYINNSRAPSSLRWKLVGISLATILVVIGIAGNIVYANADSSYENRSAATAEYMKTIMLSGIQTPIPENVSYVASYPAGSGPVPEEYELIYSVSGDLTPDAFIKGDIERNKFGHDEYQASLIKENGRAVEALEFTRFSRYFDHSNTDTYYYHYDFFHNGRVFEIGFAYGQYRLHIHQVLLQLVYVVFAITALVLVLYPAFYRRGLLVPFKSLLSVMKKVNDSNLNVTVPVYVNDEVGYLSRSFNDMIGKLRGAFNEIEEREYETLQVVGRAAEFRDPETANHISRVAHYSRLLAELIGLDKEICELMYYASPLHDVGKLGVPDSILLKNSKLTGEEYETVKEHSRMGYDMLKNSISPFLQAGSVIALSHHEKYDGTGYPEGKSGDQIHIYGRIVAVADVFDALTTLRPYKEPWPVERAVDLIVNGTGSHFDPNIVASFTKNMETILEIRDRYQD